MMTAPLVSRNLHDRSDENSGGALSFGQRLTTGQTSAMNSVIVDNLVDGRTSYDGGKDLKPRGGLSAIQLLSSNPVFRKSMRSRDSSRLFIFIAINVLYLLCELLYGISVGWLGLISDSFHLCFGCGVLSLSLAALNRADRRPDAEYTFGYERFEVLGAFVNSLFLLFVSFSLCIEALHSLIEDESEHRHYLIPSATANLLVNLIGVVFFRSFSRVRVVYRNSRDMNLHSIYLHVLSDSVRSGGVIAASWLVALRVPAADAIVNLLVSATVLMVAMPLFHAASAVLLQTAPAAMPPAAISKCLREAAACEGVYECANQHIWMLTPGTVVASVCVRVRSDADEARVRQHVHRTFELNLGTVDLTIQVEKDKSGRERAHGQGGPHAAEQVYGSYGHPVALQPLGPQAAMETHTAVMAVSGGGPTLVQQTAPQWLPYERGQASHGHDHAGHGHDHGHGKDHYEPAHSHGFGHGHDHHDGHGDHQCHHDHGHAHGHHDDDHYGEGEGSSGHWHELGHDDLDEYEHQHVVDKQL